MCMGVVLGVHLTGLTNISCVYVFSDPEFSLLLLLDRAEVSFIFISVLVRL